MAREPRRPATRGAAPQTRTSRKPSAPTSRPEGRSRYRGEEGRRQATAEQERIKQRRETRKLQNDAPFRFWMPPNTERKVIVLDDAPDFYRYEHALLNKDTGRNDIYTDCVDEFDTCPICENTDSRPYYAMYLTVIDLEGYTNKAGDRIDWTRKMFVVKSGMQRQWTRIAKPGESLRGRVFTIFRDGDKDPVTGNQIEEDLDEAPYSEDDLAAFVREWTDRESKVHTEDCFLPYDYEKIMPEMGFDELNTFVGGTAPAGSRRAEEEALGRGEEDTPERAEDAEGWEEPDDAAPFDAEEVAEEAEVAVPRRGRRAVAASAPSRDESKPVRGGRTSAPAEPEPAARRGAVRGSRRPRQ